MSFMYDKQGTSSFLTYEMEPNETLDTVGLGMIRNNHLHNVLNISFTQVDEKRYLRYNISSKITLENFFSGIIVKKRLISIFMGICEAIEDGGAYMLEPGLFVMDPQHIYVNVATDEPSLVYLPVQEQMQELNFCKFFKDIMFNVQFDTNENNDYFTRIINFLNTSVNFSVTDFHQFLTELKNGTNQSVQRAEVQKGGSGKPAGKKLPPPPPPPRPAPEFQPPVMQPPVIPSQDILTDEEPVKKKKSWRDLFRKKGQEEPEPAPVPKDVDFPIPGKDKEEHPPVSYKPKGDIGRSSVPQQVLNQGGSEAKGTVVLAGTTPTTVLIDGTGAEEKPRQAVLTRRRTGESVAVDKMIFRIGREASFVNYCIADNGTISHSHADILRNGDEYVIRDNNSANHTYVNGEIVGGDQMHPLKDGDTILLANETFIFELK